MPKTMLDGQLADIFENKSFWYGKTAIVYIIAEILQILEPTQTCISSRSGTNTKIQGGFLWLTDHSGSFIVSKIGPCSARTI